MSPCSSSPLTASSSNKLLISDLNPKSCPRKDPQDSLSLPSTDNAPPPEKRTRDLPNLSDCHCCGCRINHTNPRDRLQPLQSVWRIVLLCRKCRKNLHNGQVCPYCFEKTGNSVNLYTCGICRRIIHKDCVRNYSSFSPWRFIDVENAFSMCVDCWVPHLLVNSYAVSRFIGKNVNTESKGLSEKVNQKLKLMSMKKEQSLQSQRAELNGASDSANRKCHINNGGVIETLDDGEWDIQLRKTINSSPRIYKRRCSLNVDSIDSLKDRSWKGLTYKRTRFEKFQENDKNVEIHAATVENEHMNILGYDVSHADTQESSVGLQTYIRDRKRKVWQINVDNSVIAEPSGSHLAELKSKLHSDSYRFEKTYQRIRLKRMESRRNDQVGFFGAYSDSHDKVSESDCCQLNEANAEIHDLPKSENENIFPTVSCCLMEDRYLMKYRKGSYDTIPTFDLLSCGDFRGADNSSAPCSSNSEAGFSTDSDTGLISADVTRNREFFLKYYRRKKSL